MWSAIPQALFPPTTRQQALFVQVYHFPTHLFKKKNPKTVYTQKQTTAQVAQVRTQNVVNLKMEYVSLAVLFLGQH